MANLSEHLLLDACPHCGKANPTLSKVREPLLTHTHDNLKKRFWGFFNCRGCGGVIIAGGPIQRDDRPYDTPIREVYPKTPEINETIPEKPKEFLRQAQNTLHAPAASIMVSASAVDAMLKEKGYTEGSLYTRIDKAAEDHLITNEMASWAHQVRLDANDQRHADEDAPLPTTKDAQLAFDFATAFAEYLFVLPAKVSRGIGESASSS